MTNESPRITVVTSGQLSTSPRMLKAADALQADGYRVRVVSTRFLEWATAADREVRASRNWAWAVVDYDARTAPVRWLQSGATLRTCRAAATAFGPGGVPLGIVARAFGRGHADLVAAIAREPADLVYGGTTGGLAAVAEGARRLGVPYGLDLEDFHLDQFDGPDADLDHGLARRILDAVVPGAAVVTTASPEMRDAYAAVYPGRSIVNVCNTAPLPASPPPTHGDANHPLRLYWFGQTIGPGRGLEDAVRAAGLVGVPIELHVRGRLVAGYLEALMHLQWAAAPRLAIVHHPPAPPDALVTLARDYDVGLSLEVPTITNRAVCLPNKPLIYAVAGLAIALSDTPAQRTFAATVGPAAWLYASGDAPGLARGFRVWHENRERLHVAQAASWDAAVRRWHWEHPDDRGALLTHIGAIARTPCVS